MRFLSSSALVILAASVYAETEADATDRPEFTPTKIDAPFIEQFTGNWVDRWSASAATKETDQKESFTYEGKWSVEEPSVFPGLLGDDGLVAKTKASHHAISAQFDKIIDPKGKGLVIQYEVKLQKGLECGGAYLKVLSESSEGIHAAEFSDKTPYTIMFGPDKCGSTNKVHFIFRLKNPITGEFEEKHLETPPGIKNTKTTALYTLIITADDRYEILVNDESLKSGSLFEDFKPAVNPDKEIDDPSDSKPSDWIDEKDMIDLDDEKPADWDEDAPAEIVDEKATMPEGWLENEPVNIPDPEAVKPEEWDDEEDGDWIAPSIPNPLGMSAPGIGKWTSPIIKNPLYKGKWYPRQIPNPDYKGVWAPRKISNPDHFEIKNPSALNPIAGVGFEIWTMSEDILFDNIFIGHSAEDAKKFAAETFHLKLPLEQAAEGSTIKGDELEADIPDWKTEPVAFVMSKLSTFVDAATEDPLSAVKAYPATAAMMAAVIAALTALVTSLVSLASGGATTAAAKSAASKASTAKSALKEKVSELPSIEEIKGLASEKLADLQDQTGSTTGDVKQRATRSSVKVVDESD